MQVIEAEQLILIGTTLFAVGIGIWKYLSAWRTGMATIHRLTKTANLISQSLKKVVPTEEFLEPADRDYLIGKYCAGMKEYALTIGLAYLTDGLEGVRVKSKELHTICTRSDIKQEVIEKATWIKKYLDIIDKSISR